jgi:hypothetical protein
VPAAAVAFTSPDVTPGFRAAAGTAYMQPIGPVDRLLTPALVVAELLSWGAAITSLGLYLATWTPRPGRAIGVSVAIPLLLSFGWMFLFAEFIQPTLSTWLYARYNLSGVDLIWLYQALFALSPMAAPIVTITALNNDYAHRWQFWLLLSLWCLLAWAFAGLIYWRVLRTFDRRLGRMHGTGQDAAAARADLLPIRGSSC